MMIQLYPEYFNDVFGPITQPGSSSHMAGPCRAGLLANTLLGEKVKNIQIILDKEGSFYEGFGQMNEDIGMLNGAYGNQLDARDFFSIKEILKAHKIPFEFVFEKIEESNHPNAMHFILTGVFGKKVSLVVESTGGGMVHTTFFNGYPFSYKGDSHMLLIETNEEAANQIEKFLQKNNIVLDKGCAKKAHGQLFWYKLENKVQKSDICGINQEAIWILNPILPVATSKRKKLQKFTTLEEWKTLAAKEHKTMYEVALEYEMDASGWDKNEVYAYMHDHVEKYMKRRIHALYEDESLLINNPFRTIYYKEWEQQSKKNHLTNGVTNKAIHYMFSAQAMMKQVLDVPGPMSNGGGYLYSVLEAVKEECGLSDEDVTRGLFIAAAIGAIAYTQTNPTGEIIGCAGECGICAAMTAAAVAEMFHATPEQIDSAASFTLQSAIGWPCDPVPGAQGTPCTSRTLFIVTMPQVYVNWALMGAKAAIPFDEVLKTVDAIGRSMSSDLLCTGRGGLCATKSGQCCKEAFQKNRA